MTPEQEIAPTHRSARRRLLRGSVSVPTIMTLSSGAAIANASTIRCFNNATALPNPGSFPVRGLPRYTMTVSGVVCYYIKRSELVTMANTDGFAINTPFITASGSSAYIRIDGTAPASGTPTLESGKFVGLRFSYSSGAPSGQRFSVTGLYTTGATSIAGGMGNAMYGSCWTSCAGIK